MTMNNAITIAKRLGNLLETETSKEGKIEKRVYENQNIEGALPKGFALKRTGMEDTGFSSDTNVFLIYASDVVTLGMYRNGATELLTRWLIGAFPNNHISARKSSVIWNCLASPEQEKAHGLIPTSTIDSNPEAPTIDPIPEAWNLSHFGNVQSNIKLLLEAIDQIQKEVPNHANLAREANLHITLDEELKKEESMWMEKSKYQKILEGYLNTRFFHLTTIVRRRRNAIECIKNNEGVWIADSVISQVLNQMDSNKAPGPDVMSFVFYKSYWKTTKTDVINNVKSFFTGVHLLKEQNHTHIAPIPKLENPTVVSHYRLISLCNINYKLISKILASHLQSVLNKLVSLLQAAFVPNRLISDNSIIVQELWHTMKNKKGKNGLMTIKIDMENAYDKME
ncbi:hypothetical protein RJ639_045908 [Escallonia herrerae]|uniref:Reverse transcriptase domain-containing protein n=1 Tax=Escallonia herrerae TaxID=1293975 RepID=A0AA89AZ84_9ASTE|nr:hypothetical protein RJ639_045908 [Escallonia herrerae]